MSQTSLTDAKAHLSAYVDSVVRTHERVSLTRNGRRDAVLIAADDRDALEETLSILSDPELMADLRQSQRVYSIDDGRVVLTLLTVDHRRDVHRPR